jgi:hypothetical protein
MNIKILKTIVGISFVFWLAVISANAQSVNQFRAHIPFDFYINNQKFTAGDYAISEATSSNHQMLLVRRKDGKAQAFAPTMQIELTDKQKKGDAVLVFNRYGKDYFLSEIHNPSANFGGRLSQAKTERNLAKMRKPAKETGPALKGVVSVKPTEN